MRIILSISFILFCLYSCKTNNIVIQTYASIDSATGNYAGSWLYTHHTWQSYIQTTKIDSTYADIIAISKINQDSILITSKMGAYRFKFDAVSNTYSNSLLTEYTINTVSHTMSATGNSNYYNNTGNADTVIYQFNGKR